MKAKKISNSFSARLSINILFSVSILFIAIVGTVAVSSHMLIVEEASNSAENILHATISDIEKELQPVEVTVQSAGAFVMMNKNDDNFIRTVTNALAGTENIIGAAVAFVPEYRNGKFYHEIYSGRDKEGNVFSKELGGSDYDYFHLDWYQIPALLGKGVWSEPFYDANGTDEMVSAYSYPINDPATGELMGVVMAEVSTDSITALTSKVHPYEHSNVIMVSRCGRFVSNENKELLQGETLMAMASFSTDSNVTKFTNMMMQGESGFIRYGKGQETSFAVFGPVSNGWSLAILCQYKDILERTSKMHMILILAGLLGLLIIALICYFTVKRMTKPLSQFSESALSIAKGDFNTELPEIKSEDEIRKLHDSFVYMESSLTSYISDLKTSTAANERFESELNIARNIQMNMVPRNFPQRDGLGLYAYIEPAKEVGGDLYDFYIKGNMLYFTIGDVSGKGVPAALVMAITRAAFRFISGLDLPISTVVERINNAVADGNDAAMFVTAFAGKLNLETGEMEFCNAGHNPIVVNGKFLEVEHNIAIGLFDNFPYKAQKITLPKGSTIVLYTDGVTEAEKADKSQFGEKRLLDCIAAQPADRSAKDMTESILEEVRKFTDGNDQNDDITIMTIKL